MNEKGSESIVVTNPSLHQTTRRAPDLQNNQQPAKRYEQTPAGCHAGEQMPLLEKQITGCWGVHSYQATLYAATGTDSSVEVSEELQRGIGL